MSRIADLLDAGRTMSFEFFPPKTPEAERALEEAMAGLAPLEPSFVSVTYGALGSTVDRTRDVVIRLNQQQPFPAMSHLTCSGHRREQLVALLEDYKEAGVENVLALAGDPPADGSAVESDYTYAIELVELIHEVGGFSVGVAAHPEVHPRSTDRALDRRHLADKLAVADFAVTQFFFDAADYLAMVEELAALGCTKPIIPGVMPIASVPGVRRMAAMNSAAIPGWLQERMDTVDGDPEAVRRLGVDVATELCRKLLDAGVPGLHLYALNRANSIREIYANLGLI